MNDTLILEGINKENIESAEIETDEKVKFCLNCGTPINDKYCPHCGQSTGVPSKLKMKNFGKGVLMSFARLTPGFFATAKGLILHPWTVIRDHIHGRHVRYSPPITMVIQVFLYATILYTLIDSLFGTSLVEQYNFNEGIFNLEQRENINPLLIMLDQSVVVQALIFSFPICFIVYLAYYRHGARKYNFAEYLSAYVYMYAALIIYDIIFGLLYLITNTDVVGESLTFTLILVFSTMTLIKAFPQNKWWKHVMLLSWTAFLFLIAILIFSIIIALCFVLVRKFN